MSIVTSVREGVGHAIGALWSPAVAAISRARHARMFHPDGIVCAGHVTPIPGAPLDLGARLAGPVLARLSAALWRGNVEAIDVLGIALRFGETQDLLFATIRSPFTMPFAPLGTDQHDFLANRYWAVSPFDVENVGRMKFRLVPASPPRSAGGPRAQRLRAAIEAGDAFLRLDARRVLTRRWQPVAIVTLDRVAQVDQNALRFDPFHDGLGIVPRGLVHAIRRAVYAASQRARQST